MEYYPFNILETCFAIIFLKVFMTMVMSDNSL